MDFLQTYQTQADTAYDQMNKALLRREVFLIISRQLPEFPTIQLHNSLSADNYEHVERLLLSYGRPDILNLVDSAIEMFNIQQHRQHEITR